MVGLKIKEYLDENGIKYSYLSEKTGMPMNILSPTLNGKRKMSAEEYFMICGILGLPAETFAPDTQDDGQEQYMEGIIVTERKYINQVDAQVTISFQLASHDWLKLEKSSEWHQVEEMILEIQNKHNQKSRQDQL